MQISNLVQLKSKLNNLKFKFKDREYTFPYLEAKDINNILT